MKTTTKMTKAELVETIEAQADIIHDQDGRIKNLKETVETLNRMLAERTKAAGRAEGFAAAVVELLGGEKALYRALAMALGAGRTEPKLGSGRPHRNRPAAAFSDLSFCESSRIVET